MKGEHKGRVQVKQYGVAPTIVMEEEGLGGNDRQPRLLGQRGCTRKSLRRKKKLQLNRTKHN